MPGIPPSFNEKKSHLPVEKVEILLSAFRAPKHHPRSKKKLLFFAIFALFALVLIPFLCLRGNTKVEHISCIKARCTDFVGRKEYLDILHKELTDSLSRKNFQKNVKIKVLWGKGGFGKSELAIEFANQYLSEFSLCWTFVCDTQEHIDQGYSHLAEKLNLLASQKESPEKVRKKVHFYLENHRFERPWLLIFDNVENEFTDYPQRGGMILVTSQKKVFNPTFLLEITPLSKEESLELIEKITKEKRDEKMELLVEDLERIPLLINYAAHYIKATPGCDAGEYHQLFYSHFLEKEGPLWKEMDINRRYLKSLAASWAFPLKSLEKENPLAVNWLFVCSYLYPERIPEAWIDGWMAQKSVNSTVRKNELLKSLQNYGIIDYEKKTKTFSLHRFFQYMLRESRKLQLEEDLGETIALLAKYATGYDFQESSSWKEAKWWYLNARETRKILDNHSIQFSNPHIRIQQAILYQGIAEWCAFHNRYSINSLQEALKSAEQALTLKKSVLPENSLEVASAYECFGWILYALDQYPEALAACAQSEKIHSHFLGERPLEYALLLATKGTILEDLGKYEEALHCFTEELAIRNQLQGMHSRMGWCLSSQAKCLRGLERYTEAMECHERALNIYRKTCGESHPWFFSALKNKALTMYRQGRYKDAMKLFSQTISNLTLIRGEDHEDLVGFWDGIGWCHIHLGNFKKAKKIFEKTLESGLANQNRRFLSQSYKGLGWSYLKNKEVKEGLHYLTLHLEVSAQIYRETPKMDAILKDFQKAIQEAVAIGGNPDDIAHAITIGDAITKS